MPRHSPCALYSLTYSRFLVLYSWIMQAIYRLLFRKIVIVTHIFLKRCSTIKIHNFLRLIIWKTFCCLAFITFQYIVQFSRCKFQLLLKSDRNPQSLLNTSVQLQKIGGDSRDRTGDLLLARQALSQLSYIPISYLHLLFEKRGGPEWARTTDLTIISRTL